MAKVPPGTSVKRMVGLPTKEQLMTAPQNTDTIPAVIKDQTGVVTGPAALTEGEIVFSIPAIIAIGQGSYDKGKMILTQTHERLRIAGETLMRAKELEGNNPQNDPRFNNSVR